MLKKWIAGVGMLFLFLAWVTVPILMLEKQAQAAKPKPVKMEVLLPTGTADIKPAQLAKRVDSLDGKRIALHWNGKPGGEYLLAEVEAQLKAKYKNATIYQWPKGTAWKTDVAQFIKNQPVDVAILSVGD